VPRSRGRLAKQRKHCEAAGEEVTKAARRRHRLAISVVYAGANKMVKDAENNGYDVPIEVQTTDETLGGFIQEATLLSWLNLLETGGKLNFPRPNTTSGQPSPQKRQ